MKCSLCGFEFEESEAGRACAGCSLGGGCSLIRCPNCGYEWPREPGWLSGLKRLWRKDNRHGA